VYNEKFSDTRRKFLEIWNFFVAYDKKIFTFIKNIKNFRHMLKTPDKCREMPEKYDIF
jgi:hypothetical protein